jgi:23S rRNA (guanosine2251-2'-O)-methyltransferase
MRILPLPVNTRIGKGGEIFTRKDNFMSRHSDDDTPQSGRGKGKALRGRAGRNKGGRGSGRASAGAVRLWGHHAVEAALKNPDRRHRKLWATREAIANLDGELPADFTVEYAQAADLGRLVARDAPHQGLVLECDGLEDIYLDDVLDGDPSRPVIVLDQVTDPHNVGAILRSAAAFNAACIVTRTAMRHPNRARLPSRPAALWKSCHGSAWSIWPARSKKSPRPVIGASALPVRPMPPCRRP